MPTKDWNKGIDTISYNSLNLPDRLSINSSSVKAENYYTYTASGVKLNTRQYYAPNFSLDPVSTIYTNSDSLSNYKITDYAGNITYEVESKEGNITNKTRILVDGGYIEDGVYHFYLTDHLGNNRVVAKADGTVIQQTHYYPFGMAFAESTGSEAQPYKYNGKELDQLHGLNLYDYSARYYDPGTPLFTTIDPFAEKFYSVSPYVYALNNPLRFIDPDGREVGVPEWIRGYAIGAWSAGAGMVTGIVSANPVSAAQTGVGEMGKVVNAYQSGGVGAAAEQYATSVYETSGAQALVQTAQGVANGNPEAIGAAVTMGVAAVMTHQVGKSGGVKTEGMPQANKPYAPRDKVTGELVKTEKTKAGNTKIDAEARGKAHTQLRTDESGNYVQRTTFDAKGRKRADTHFTTHGEPGKSNPHKHTYYKDGRRQKQTP